jgi:hypothetical protein
MTDHWINQLLPLDRPAYVKQPESLLTDLIWRSLGSSLQREISVSRTNNLNRLVPRRNHGTKPGTMETMPIAEDADIGKLVLEQSNLPKPTRALLSSIVAPKSRGDKNLTCVPVHPDLVVLQTLAGILNKSGPPNIADIIETIGWFGGSDGKGHVAFLLLETMSQRTNINDGLTGFLDQIAPLLATFVWDELAKQATQQVNSKWSPVRPMAPDISLGNAIISQYQFTPFTWFWDKWKCLCDKDNGWYDVLPSRRFVDWATCILRTGLSFAYLWEATFFVSLHNCVVEELEVKEGMESDRRALYFLASMLKQGTALATFEAPWVPSTQKHSWNALSNLIAKGYLSRKRLEQELSKSTFQPPETSDVEIVIQSWLEFLSLPLLKELASPLAVKNETATDTKEFIRYLLRPRSADDDTRDQADFYYVAQTNSKFFWFEPGPEWLVVMTSLLSGKPGKTCTLGMLLRDLQMLGIRVERRILVNMLEQAGLTTDSPDADNALVIQSGF